MTAPIKATSSTEIDAFKKRELYSSEVNKTFIKKNSLDHQSASSVVLDIENAANSGLSVFFVGAAVSTAAAFLIPTIPFIFAMGLVLGTGGGIIAGAYSAIRERQKRNKEEEAQIAKIKELSNKETLLDYLAKSENEVMSLLRALQDKSPEEIAQINAALPDGNLLKGKLINLPKGTAQEQYQSLKKTLVDEYSRERVATEKAQAKSRDSLYSNYLKHGVQGIANMSTAMWVCSIIGVAVVLTLSLSPPVLLGIAALSISAGIGAIVAGISGIARKKLEDKDKLQKRLLDQMENQQKQIADIRQASEIVLEKKQDLENTQTIQSLTTQLNSKQNLEASKPAGSVALEKAEGSEKPAVAVLKSLLIIPDKIAKSELLLSKEQRKKELDNKQLTKPSASAVLDMGNFTASALSLFLITAGFASATAFLLPAAPFIVPLAFALGAAAGIVYGAINTLFAKRSRDQAEKINLDKLDKLAEEVGLIDYFEEKDVKHSYLYQLSESLSGKSVMELKKIDDSLPADNVLKGKIAALTDLSSADSIHNNLSKLLTEDYLKERSKTLQEKKEIHQEYEKYGKHGIAAMQKISTVMIVCGLAGAVLTTLFVASPPVFLGLVGVSIAGAIGIGVATVTGWFTDKLDKKEKKRDAAIDSIEAQKSCIQNIEKSSENALNKAINFEKNNQIKGLEEKLHVLDVSLNLQEKPVSSHAINSEAYFSKINIGSHRSQPIVSPPENKPASPSPKIGSHRSNPVIAPPENKPLKASPKIGSHRSNPVIAPPENKPLKASPKIGSHRSNPVIAPPENPPSNPSPSNSFKPG